MKNAVLYFFLLLSVIAVHAQDGRADCGMYGKKTVEQRNKLFPFNKVKEVLLVSYGDYELKSSDDTVTQPPGLHKYVVQNEGFRERIYNTIEEIELSKQGMDSLSNILVNYIVNEDKESYLVSTDLCYTPRNSILFLDEEGEIICNYELCFECDRFVLSPDPENLTHLDDVQGCEGKLELIRELFRKNGIKYGVEER